MRLAMLLTAAVEWVRALAGPLALLLTGAGLFCLAWQLGVDRVWPAVIAGALAAGLGLGWGVLTAATHTRRQQAERRRTDGEGEPL